MNNCFDWKFYMKTYPNLTFATEKEAYNHWIDYGSKVNLACCLNKMKENMDEFIKIAEEQSSNYVKKKQSEDKINILVRTSNRPTYFKECIESILNQNYSNYKVIIGYDKVESLEYLNNYKDNDKIEIYPMSTTSKEYFKHNLYLNTMMDKVTDGFIMYLDDDDMMSHNNSLNILNENIVNENDLIIWKFMRPDKLICPKSNVIKKGHISGCAYSFNSKYKLKSRWVDRQCSDYIFITGLLKKIKLNIKIIDYILTRIISEDRIGNFGK